MRPAQLDESRDSLIVASVAQGDLSQTMANEIEGRSLQGEFLRTARTVNSMVNQLSSFAAEVTRVAREAGTEGKLGGQADVRGVAAARLKLKVSLALGKILPIT